MRPISREVKWAAAEAEKKHKRIMRK